MNAKFSMIIFFSDAKYFVFSKLSEIFITYQNNVYQLTQFLVLCVILVVWLKMYLTIDVNS